MLLDNGLTQIGFSLDAATPETFEKIRAGASWDAVMENFRTFIRLRNDRPTNRTLISFNFALMRQNVHEAVEFVRFAKEMGATSVAFAHLIAETAEMMESSLANDPAESNRLSAALREEVARLGFHARIPVDLPECVVPFTGPLLENPEYHGYCAAAYENWLFLRPNGDCFPCLNLYDCASIGNVYETPFREIWYGEPNQHFRRRAIQEGVAEGCDHCKECTLTDDLSSQVCFLAKRLTTRSAYDSERDIRREYR
jgi:radical SAM protein with 4Fe4S-binding SPASM domain